MGDDTRAKREAEGTVQEIVKVMRKYEAGDDDNVHDELHGMPYGMHFYKTMILTLAGGGPAVRLHVTEDDTTLEYSDWGIPWTPYYPKEEEQAFLESFGQYFWEFDNE